MCKVLQNPALCDLIFGSIHCPANLILAGCLNAVLKNADEFLSLASDCPMIFFKTLATFGW